MNNSQPRTFRLLENKLKRKCPICKAKPGEPCLHQNGNPMTGQAHRER